MKAPILIAVLLGFAGALALAESAVKQSDEGIDMRQKSRLGGSELVAQGEGDETCEDKLEAVAELAPDLDCELFRTSETRRQPWVVEHDDGTLEDTMDGIIGAEDLLLVEKTADCISTHQGGHAMEFCDAVKTADGVELAISGGAPAYMSSLAVTIDAKRRFVCRFKAVYPSPDGAEQWKVTKKVMKLKSGLGEPGKRLRGWLSVEFDEIDGVTGEAKSYKIEGYFKPLIQSPASVMEVDK
jgi:hypothetical protein